MKNPDGTFSQMSGGGGIDQETYTQIMDIIGDASDSVSFSLTPTQCECTYYKCTSVTTVSAAPQGATLTMHQGSAQWVFHLQDASATGDSRVWVSQA